MVELVSVPFCFCFDTNNLLKNRITSGMHIYSSPRNMSVNLGSVSTKHEQHLLPNRLYPQQIWHCAHSFCFRFLLYFLASLIFHISVNIFLLIIDRSLEKKIPQNLLPHLSLTVTIWELFSSPSLPQAYTRTLHLLWMKYICVSLCARVRVCVCVFACVRACVWWYWGAFWSEQECKHTAWLTAGVQKHPFGCGYKPFFFACVCVRAVCTRVSDCVNKKTKINLPKQHIPWQYTGHLLLFLFFDTFLWVSFSVKKPCCLQYTMSSHSCRWTCLCFLDHFLCHSLPSRLSYRPKACKSTYCSDWTGIWW